LISELFGTAGWAAGAAPADDTTAGLPNAESDFGGYGVRHVLLFGAVSVAVVGVYLQLRKSRNAAQKKVSA